MEEILKKMKENINNTKIKLMSCKDVMQLDVLAYELVAKEEIFGAIENNLINIEDYIEVLQEEENPLEKIFRTFMRIIWESNRIIDDEQIYDCLDTIKEDFKNE